MGISIRNHCIPAYDEIRRIERVAELPEHLKNMEEGTAGGICLKIRKILESDFFASLPPEKIIASGLVSDFKWRKSDAEREMARIVLETKDFVPA